MACARRDYVVAVSGNDDVVAAVDVDDVGAIRCQRF